MTSIQKIAITGANGFLGTHTIKRAIKKGWVVNAIVRRDEVIGDIKSLGALPFVVKDFNIEQFEDAFSGCKAVLHFANIVCGSKESFEKVNIIGLKNLLIAAENVGIPRIIYPSGLGISKYNVEEWATNNYFWSKKKAEELLIQSNIPYVIFRPSYILGPNDELIPDIIEQIYDGYVYIVGDGNIPMQPIFIEDAVAAFLNASIGKGKDNMIYSLVGPEVINMVNLVERILEQIENIGLSLPKPEYRYLNYKEAVVELKICSELIDVMRCNLTFDGNKTARALEFELSPLNKAINAAVRTKLVPKMKNPGMRAILMLSGGIDSVTALYWALNEGYEIIALSLNYKWRPKREIEAVQKICEINKIKLVEVPIPYVMEATDLRLEGYPSPSSTDAPEGYIPLKNLLFYSISAYFAEVYGANYIIGGHHRDDLQNFPDSSPNFFKNLETIIKYSKHKEDKHKISFLFPFSGKSKNDILKIAHELRVPIDLTWSCYGDFQEPCGKCNPCLNRQKAIDNYKS